MSDDNVPAYGGVIHPITGLPSSTRQPARFSKRRPPGLALKEVRQFKPYEDSEHSMSNCGVCQGTLPINPQLCDDCQIWNSTEHIFRCLREKTKWEARQSFSLESLMSRTACIVCQAISSAVLTKYSTSEPDTYNDLLQANVSNLGPYCLGLTALNEVDYTALERSGLHRIDPNDVRLPQSSSNNETSGSRIRTTRMVLYIKVVAAPDSNLRRGFPELTGDVAGPLSKWSTDVYWKNRNQIVEFGVDRVESDSGVPELPQPTIGLQLALTYAHKESSLSKVEPWENDMIDIPQLKQWMENCQESHGRRCNLGDGQPLDWMSKHSTSVGQGWQTRPPKGFIAIDTQRYCIQALSSDPIPKYAALSYTWGASAGIKELQLEQSNYTDLLEEGSLKKYGGIPDVILDSITLCANMGEQYLWVDRLCIVQDDSASKHSQIQAMDKIYYLATFTIIAAVPLGVGLPGVTGRPRKPSLWNNTRRFHPQCRAIASNFDSTVLTSFWNTRGWTFQERILPRRAIYITEFQTYFVCNRRSYQEDVDGISVTVKPWNLHLLPQYFVTVASYTERNLSFPSDILNAFTGIGNRFADSQGKPLLFGLPERYLPQALLWENCKEMKRREEAPQIPSWTWAAWKGQSIYDTNRNVEKLHVGTLVRFYFQDPKGGLRLVHAEETWFFKNFDFETMKNLPDVNDMCPEMRYMPNAKDAERYWRDCPHNPWEVAGHDIDPSVAASASSHAGSLVFVTTSAFVGLRLPSLEGLADKPFFVELDIVDHAGSTIGQMAQLPYAWISEHVDLDVKHEVIVICAGIADEPSRYDRMQKNLQVEAEGDSNLTENPWYLHVMLVRRVRKDGVAYRVAVGVVEVPSWRQCKPEWRTVVLV